MTDEKSETERVADALERVADELQYQNAILTEQARAQHLTAVSANEYSEPDERATSAPNTRSLLTMIRDAESERERAENRRLMGDGGYPFHEPTRDDLAKVERDAVLCGRCDDPDEEDELTATPAGPLCSKHADELAEEMVDQEGRR